MPTLLVEIDPCLVGPVSMGTVGVVKHLVKTLGLTLSEAKAAVDLCVFEQGVAMFHLGSLARAQTLGAELEELGRAQGVRLTARIAAPREATPHSMASSACPDAYLAPDLCQLTTPLHAAFPQLEDEDIDKLLRVLGSILYTPRRYLEAYRAGIITSTELRDTLLAHVQTEASASLSRHVPVEELAPLEHPLDELLFVAPEPQTDNGGASAG